MYSLLLRSCKLTGAFIIHPCLPFGGVVAKQQGLFAPRPLRRFLATTGPSATLSPFRRLPGSASYTASLLPSISRPGRVGLLQLLSASLSSCCRSNPARVSRRIGQCCDVPCCLRLMKEGSASGVNRFEASCAFTFVAARRLAHHPEDGFVDRLSGLGFPPPYYPSYRALASTLVSSSSLNAPAFTGHTFMPVHPGAL